MRQKGKKYQNTLGFTEFGLYRTKDHRIQILKYKWIPECENAKKQSLRS